MRFCSSARADTRSHTGGVPGWVCVTFSVASAMPYPAHMASARKPAGPKVRVNVSMVEARTGSEPFAANRRDERSSRWRTSLPILVAATSKPKFGAAVCVPANRVMASSHRAGRCKNAVGSMNVTGTPPEIGVMRPQTRPKS
jgi:hypothetical protein